MRSELINEIFSVEDEAEKIVHEAQLKRQKMVSQAQSDGEKALQEATEKKQVLRDRAIITAQEESEERIAKAEKAFQATEAQKIDLESCADSIAAKFVDLLCSTKLGELS